MMERAVFSAFQNNLSERLAFLVISWIKTDQQFFLKFRKLSPLS